MKSNKHEEKIQGIILSLEAKHLLITASFIAGIVFSSVASTDDSNYDSDNDDGNREAAASSTKTKRLKQEGSGGRNNHHYQNQIKFVR